LFLFANTRTTSPASSGGTVLEAGDVVLVLANKNNLAEIRQTLMRWKKPKEEEPDQKAAAKQP